MELCRLTCELPQRVRSQPLTIFDSFGNEDGMLTKTKLFRNRMKGQLAGTERSPWESGVNMLTRLYGPPGNVWSSTSLPANDAELGRQFQAEYQEVVSNTAA